mgnify:FL=1
MVLLSTHEKAFFVLGVCVRTQTFLRAYIYNKEKNEFEMRKVFTSVKFERKMQLSSRKIWWNEK